MYAFHPFWVRFIARNQAHWSTSLTVPVSERALLDQSKASYVEKTKKETDDSRECLSPRLCTQDEKGSKSIYTQTQSSEAALQYLTDLTKVLGRKMQGTTKHLRRTSLQMSLADMQTGLNLGCGVEDHLLAWATNRVGSSPHRPGARYLVSEAVASKL